MCALLYVSPVSIHTSRDRVNSFHSDIQSDIRHTVQHDPFRRRFQLGLTRIKDNIEWQFLSLFASMQTLFVPKRFERHVASASPVHLKPSTLIRPVNIVNGRAAEVLSLVSSRYALFWTDNQCRPLTSSS